MTLNETVELMAVIKAAYPSFYAYQREKDKMEAAMKLWADQLSDIPYDKAQQVLSDYIGRESNPPTIADIKRPFAQHKNPEAVWQELGQAAKQADKYAQWRRYPALVGWDDKQDRPLYSDGTEELRELYNGLSPDARAFAGSPDRLIDFGRNGMDEWQHSQLLRQVGRSESEPTIDDILRRIGSGTITLCITEE